MSLTVGFAIQKSKYPRLRHPLIIRQTYQCLTLGAWLLSALGCNPLSELYQKVKKGFTKDDGTGLLLTRVKVKLPQSDDEAVIVFSKGYCEPEINITKGKKKKKEPKWAAFLSTNTSIHSSTIIKKYIKRWPIENYRTLGSLFEHLADDSAVIIYTHRLWDFFQGLFRVSFSNIFQLFKIEDDFQSYVDALSEALTGFTPFQGCET